MSSSSASFSDLLQRVTDLAEPVGFRAASQAPAGGRLWQSSYALLYLCPATPESLGSVCRSAAYWLDDQLSIHEDEGRPMDGYLLLALDAPPSPEVDNRVKVIEQDPSFCRKHVLWPEAADSWDNRLERVTVLALGNLPSPAEPVTIPELPTEAEKAWQRYRQAGHMSAVVSSILSELGLDEYDDED